MAFLCPRVCMVSVRLFSQPKDMHVSVISDYEFGVGVNGCLTLCVSSATD